MCGIYSILCYYNKSFINNYTTKTNSRSLSARGPDDFATYNDSYIHMDFYRLAINGISNGKQPMIYKNYVAKSTTGYYIFIYFFIFWSLYGVAALLPYYTKNILFNFLDLFSKNFFGIFLVYIIYTGNY